MILTTPQALPVYLGALGVVFFTQHIFTNEAGRRKVSDEAESMDDLLTLWFRRAEKENALTLPDIDQMTNCPVETL